MYTVKKFNSISEIVRTALLEKDYLLSDAVENYDAALVRSADLHEIAFPENLLAIARAGAGVNNIPLEECAQKGIVVFNTPGANAGAVKELTLCGLLLAGRKVIDGINWVSEQHAAGVTGLEKLAEKQKSQYVGHELAGKKLGVVGLGAIGVQVANAASAGLGMEVMGYDPFLSVQAAWKLSRSIRQATTIEEIFAECDYVTMHLPLNDATRGMVGEKLITTMKDGAVLLNFSRGGLVEYPALLAALDAGKLSRYITDFAADEMVGHPGVIAMPHLGASTPESEENCAEMAAAQLADYLENGNITNSVNFPACNLPRSGAWRLCILNKNIKGMVGSITAVLAQEGLNIEHMMNTSKGEVACTVIETDNQPTEKCCDALRAIDGIIRVRALGK